MTELCITRGRDVGLSVDGEPLCGVTHFSAVSRYPKRELREYLCSEPYAAVGDGESHEIVLTVLSLFSGILPQGQPFTLCAEDGDERYCYEGCTVEKIERDVRGDKAVADRYTIKARRLTKRGTEDDG